MWMWKLGEEVHWWMRGKRIVRVRWRRREWDSDRRVEIMEVCAAVGLEWMGRSEGSLDM